MLCHTQPCLEYLWKRDNSTPAAEGNRLYLRTQDCCGFLLPSKPLVGLRKSAKSLQSKEEASSPWKRSPWWPNAPQAPPSPKWGTPESGTRGPAEDSDLCWRMSFPRASWKTQHLWGSSAVADTPNLAVFISWELQRPYERLTIWHFMGVISFLPHLNSLRSECCPVVTV